MTTDSPATGIVQREEVSPHNNPSVVSVALIGCGGCGINLTRPFKDDARLTHHLYFDTSMTNTRLHEKCNVLTSGLGSGANRAENAKEIDRAIPQIDEVNLGLADVMIVVASLGGGSGSVIQPLLMREYHRRGKRVIGVCVSDTSYSIAATNTLNTLKTLTAVSTNNGIYLPLVILSNDAESSRKPVDDEARNIIDTLIQLLTQPVYEIDRNDRLNWVNPSKVVGSQPGLKILSVEGGDKPASNPNVVLGGKSTDMVDATLVLQNADEAQSTKSKNPTRLKKVGIFPTDQKMVAGTVSSDISDITNIITLVERAGDQERSQTHEQIDKLHSTGKNDLIL